MRDGGLKGLFLAILLCNAIVVNMALVAKSQVVESGPGKSSQASVELHAFIAPTIQQQKLVGQSVSAMSITNPSENIVIINTFSTTNGSIASTQYDLQSNNGISAGSDPNLVASLLQKDIDALMAHPQAGHQVVEITAISY